MIIDTQTNFLYLAYSLTLKYPAFYKKLAALINQHQITQDIIHGTKDIWAVDYLPIQLEEKRFVQFNYSPYYFLN